MSWDDIFYCSDGSGGRVKGTEEFKETQCNFNMLSRNTINYTLRNSSDDDNSSVSVDESKRDIRRSEPQESSEQDS